MARKSVFESVIEIPVKEKVKEKIVTARIPQNIYAEYDDAVDRLKKHGRSVSLTKVIILALQETTACANSEADKLDAEHTSVNE